MGAWIETVEDFMTAYELQSRPPWARGLKLRLGLRRIAVEVAPPVGAWIETPNNDNGGIPAAHRRSQMTVSPSLVKEGDTSTTRGPRRRRTASFKAVPRL